MKIIAAEEHFVMPPKPGAPAPKGLPPLEQGTMLGAPWLTNPACATDLDDVRIGIMDQDDVTMQVLSTPFGQVWTAEVAVQNCKEANDFLAAAIKRHPDRFAGFAAIPTAVPEACDPELERAVKELGFVGCLIGNRVNGTKFLDDPEFEDLLAACEKLDVPIYLHPGAPPAEITALCYSGFNDEMVSAYSRYGMGWHTDVGLHMLHMVMSGVFDRHPDLQMILGHWGELLPYYVDRFDTAMPKEFAGLKHDPSYYLRNNMYVTSSGIQSPECFEFCVKVLGADRIIYSADYPFASVEGADKLFNCPSISEEDREKFAHGNAERLFKL